MRLTAKWHLKVRSKGQNYQNWHALRAGCQFGQQFKVHPDGHFKRNDDEVSMVTMLIYLNEDFIGGETEFVMPWKAIPPKTGKLLLFRHNQLHKGNPVPQGIKYVLRTDVMYKRVNNGT